MQDRRRDPEATRNAILDTAEELFLERGFADVSLSRIASDSGVTKSLIHHHFGSKDQLWDAVKVRFFSGYFEAQQQMLVDEPPTIDLLKKSMIIYFNYLKQKPEFVRLNCWMMLEGDHSCEDMAAQIVKGGADKIRESQELGHIRADLDPNHILISFLSLVEHWFLGRGRFCQEPYLNPDGKGSPDEDYLNDMMQIFFDGITPK